MLLIEGKIHISIHTGHVCGWVEPYQVFGNWILLHAHVCGLLIASYNGESGRKSGPVEEQWLGDLV